MLLTKVGGRGLFLNQCPEASGDVSMIISFYLPKMPRENPSEKCQWGEVVIVLLDIRHHSHHAYLRLSN